MFRKSKSLIKDSILPMLSMIQLASKGKDIISDQVKRKMDLYHGILKCIDQAIGQGK